MERVDLIMERLGFNKEADDGVKAAFVKNLIKQAYGVDVPLPAQYELKAQQPQSPEEMMERFSRDTIEGKPLPEVRRPREGAQQLSFDLECVTTEPKVG